jgi:hypothetical protein
MSNLRTLLRATAIVAGSSTALLLGGLVGTAHADPGPSLPTPNIGDQLVTTVANAPQILQNLAGALGGQPATPPPLASAAIKMPPSAAVPGATSAIPGASSVIPGASSVIPGASSVIPGAVAPAATSATPGLGLPGLTPTVPAPAAPTAGLPGLPGLSPTVPAAAAPVTGPAGLLPQAQLNLPQLPFLGVPLPQQISLPGDLTSLATGGVASPPAAASVPAVAPVTTPNPLLFPVSGLP